jgi:hypothetical protein
LPVVASPPPPSATAHERLVHAHWPVAAHVHALHPSEAFDIAPAGPHACPLTAGPMAPTGEAVVPQSTPANTAATAPKTSQKPLEAVCMTP